MTGSLQPRVLMVLTREIPARPNSGRERTLSSIRRALAAHHELREVVVDSVAQHPSASRALGVLGRLLRGLLSFRPCPLQVAIFHNPAGLRRILTEIDDYRPDAMYFDGVRTMDFLLKVRDLHPRLRLLCDFDDLMSLRFEMLLERRLPISLGYLRRHVPPPVQDFLQRGFVTRLILSYEATALRHRERATVVASDAVTVVSSSDVVRLRANVGQELAAKTHVLPPVVSFAHNHMRMTACSSFVFIGTDTLLQNRLTIEFLLELWRSSSPPLPLRIIGRMTQPWPETPKVEFIGFVDEIADVYRDDCVALCPSFVEGGIKTKVLEALGHGVIPVGNALTFQGMGCDPGALALDEPALREFVLRPDAYLPELLKAAATLRDCVHARYAFGAVAATWTTLLAAD